MEVAFIVKMEIPDVSAIGEIAGELQDDLFSAGYDITSVEPWARPALGLNPGAATLQGQPFINPVQQPPSGNLL